MALEDIGSKGRIYPISNIDDKKMTRSFGNLDFLILFKNQNFMLFLSRVVQAEPDGKIYVVS